MNSVHGITARPIDHPTSHPRTPAETGSAPAAAHDTRSTPQDQVLVSNQARQMAAGLAVSAGPELQLSPKQLQALMTPKPGTDAAQHD